MTETSGGTSTTSPEPSADRKSSLAPILFLKVDDKFKNPKELNDEIVKLKAAKYAFVRITSAIKSTPMHKSLSTTKIANTQGKGTSTANQNSSTNV